MYKLAKKIIVPNDKVSKIVFSLTPTEFSNVINGGRCTISESQKCKKNKRQAVKTFIYLKFDSTADENCSTPLDAFDRAVFCAAISERLAGNNTTSLPAIFRLMHGKYGKDAGRNFRPTDKQAKEILQSLKKLSSLRIVANLDEVCKRFHYNGGDNFSVDNPILPCRIYEGRLNGGNDTTLIEFTDESPLLSIAKLKNNQLLTFDANLLTDDSNFNHDYKGYATAARFYTLIRIVEIKLHKLMPIITVDDIFEKCLIDAEIRHERKAHCLDAINFLLENLKSENVIKSFILQKDNQNNKLFNSIKIQY